jgi:hypothetical protein
MRPPFVVLRDNRVQAARAFAEQFNRFEWKYLCSCQRFLSSMDRALDTGDFFPIQIRAEKALVDAKLRREPTPMTSDEWGHDNISWLHYS